MTVACGCPKHTFYVDNIFVYLPLPHCKKLYYLDLDLYRYFIGREDQSVNEKVMLKRVDSAAAGYQADDYGRGISTPCRRKQKKLRTLHV